MLPKISNIMPTIKALNLWTLTQKIKDHTTQRTPTIQLLQRIDVYDTASMKLVKSTGDMKSHSFVKNFLFMIEPYLAHAYLINPSTVNVLDTGNTSRDYPFLGATGVNVATLGVESGSNDDTYGIQIGTGVTAPANTDYTIQTQIAHGVAATQMQYGTCGVTAAAIVGANVDLVITRPFVNSSGSTITIREITLVTLTLDSTADPRFFCLVHDAANQAVDDGQTATVTYTIRTTV
jgi:hypothetical protein